MEAPAGHLPKHPTFAYRSCQAWPGGLRLPGPSRPGQMISAVSRGALQGIPGDNDTPGRRAHFGGAAELAHAGRVSKLLKAAGTKAPFDGLTGTVDSVSVSLLRSFPFSFFYTIFLGNPRRPRSVP